MRGSRVASDAAQTNVLTIGLARRGGNWCVVLKRLPGLSDAKTELAVVVWRRSSLSLAPSPEGAVAC